MLKKVKTRLFNLIRDDDVNDLPANIFDGSIIALILINVILIILDTFSFPDPYHAVSEAVETFSVAVFTLEYLCRLWVSDLQYPERSPGRARLHYIFSWMAVFDLLAILPFYLPFVFPFDLRVLRSLRLIHMFRLIRVNRFTTAFHTVTTVFRKKTQQLLSSIFLVGILMVVSSILMYDVEHEAQPEVFTNALSGFWWAISTLTTVGYGDIYPVTVLGKILSAVISVLGVGMIAVPAGILAAGFTEAAAEAKAKAQEKGPVSGTENEDEKKYCPYCGHRLGE